MCSGSGPGHSGSGHDCSKCRRNQAVILKRKAKRRPSSGYHHRPSTTSSASEPRNCRRRIDMDSTSGKGVVPFEHEIIDLQQIMIQPFSGWQRDTLEPAILDNQALRAFEAIPEIHEDSRGPFAPAQSSSMPVRKNQDLEDIF